VIFIKIFVVLFIIYLVIKLFKPKQNKGKNKIIKKSTFEIPNTIEGYKTYEFEDDNEFFVHGVHYREKAVIEWAQGDNLKLYPKREANNEYDSNAIAIQGESSGKKKKDRLYSNRGSRRPNR